MAAAILLVIGTLHLSSFPQVLAQSEDITIETSADRHEMKFFGEGAVQIVIIDENTDGNNDDMITVTIDADGGGNDASDSFSIPNTNPGSQRFEFFLVHADSQYADGIADDGTELDTDNADGFDDLSDGFDLGAPLIRFGDGVELDTDSNLYEDISFEINYRDQQVRLDYEETLGGLSLDRESFGTNSFVYISIDDQDANLNPSGRDKFIVDPFSVPNADLFDLSGGEFVSALTFIETGVNTAVFEARYELGNTIEIDSQSLTLTLYEKSNYSEDLSAPENSSNATDQVSFFVGNTSGTIQVGPEDEEEVVQTVDPLFSSDKESYRVGEIVTIVIEDADANYDQDVVDSIEVSLSSSISPESIFLAFETDEDTGEFEISFPLVANASAGGIAVRTSDNVTLQYTDMLPASYAENGDSTDFYYTIKVTAAERDDLVIVTEPIVRGSGNGSSLRSGDEVVLSTSIMSNSDVIGQQFVAIVEVRDSDGITVFLALQSGTLNADGQVEVGASWIPENAGDYEVRVFAVSNTDQPSVLTFVSTTGITVG